MGWSVSISRICRVKEFQNPTVHTYRSYRKEFAYAISKEAEEQAAARRERKWGADGDWNCTPVPSRRASDREIKSRYPRHSLEESQRRLERTGISRTPCLSFRELSREHHLLGADDRSFRRWCSDGQTTRNVYLSNQTLSFSSPPKIRSDSWIRRKKKQRSNLPLWKNSWKSMDWWRKTKHSLAKRTHRYWSTARNR